MALLYYLLQLLFYPLILPYLLYLSRRERYRESIPARFWLKNNPPFSHKSPYWFHACSLGEVNSIAPLLKRADRPNLSVITNTGRRRGEQLVGGERCRYLPIELFIPMWGYRPRRLISVEGELWYFLFWWVRRGGGKVVIVNGRIPDRSYPRYRRFRWFYRYLFREVDLILAQSELDRERYLELGARRVEVVGNIKSYTDYTPTKFYRFEKPVVVVASTHRGEELPILKQIDYNRFQVVVAPRHPERFEEVAQLMERFADSRGLKWRRLGGEGEQPFADLYLVDRLGELINLYSIADRVILGGSFIPGIGGHNPMEIAHFGKPLIIGPYADHQRELLKLVEGVVETPIEAAGEVVNADSLPSTTILNRVDLDRVWELIKIG